MPVVARATPGAVLRALCFSLKVRLSLQVCRCELSAAFDGRPNEQVFLLQCSPLEFRSEEQFTAVVQIGNPRAIQYGGWQDIVRLPLPVMFQ
jgi:hypothetical protein